MVELNILNNNDVERVNINKLKKFVMVNHL
jgi:hypothetical protein